MSESEAAPSSKTLPFPEEDTLERMALLAYWSRQYRLFDQSGLTGLAQPVWRNWCWMNCAAVLEGWRNQVVKGGITTNKGLTITRFGGMVHGYERHAAALLKLDARQVHSQPLGYPLHNH